MTLLKSKNSLLPDYLSDFFDDDTFLKPVRFKEIGKWIPAVNIIENTKEYKIEMAAPGFEKSDFKVEVDGDILTVTGEMKNEISEENEKFTRQEFTSASFSRSFTLPTSIKEADISCKYTNGILKLIVPKNEVSVQKNTKKTIAIN